MFHKDFVTFLSDYFCWTDGIWVGRCSARSLQLLKCKQYLCTDELRTKRAAFENWSAEDHRRRKICWDCSAHELLLIVRFDIPLAVITFFSFFFWFGLFGLLCFVFIPPSLIVQKPVQWSPLQGLGIKVLNTIQIDHVNRGWNSLLAAHLKHSSIAHNSFKDEFALSPTWYLFHSEHYAKMVENNAPFSSKNTQHIIKKVMCNQPLDVFKVVAGTDTAQSSNEFLSPTHGQRDWNKGCMENPLAETYVETKHFGFRQISRGPSTAC